MMNVRLNDVQHRLKRQNLVLERSRLFLHRLLHSTKRNVPREVLRGMIMGITAENRSLLFALIQRALDRVRIHRYQQNETR